MGDRERFTKKQQSVIASLEKALKRIHASDLVLYGMDDRLLVATMYDYEENGHSINNMNDADVLERVDHHGAYKDSGGF